ncbi:MAG: aminoglycoside phosphotransferase family protein [Desulfobacteraceae bacterium]|nr:aminoglycoside phosphotransferase family protein [Desulfobacteraceae bacterium]
MQDLMQSTRPRVEHYLNNHPDGIIFLGNTAWKVQALAQGEYNLNYLIRSASGSYVFRVNIGTQIGREDQISYEYNALKLLEHSNVTPVPFFVDDSRRFFDTGILIMEYLPGEHLSYRHDLKAAARLFATLHQFEIACEHNHLIPEDAPFSQIYDECSGLLEVYFTSDLAVPDIREYLREVIDWADQHRSEESYFQQDSWHCITNTEVNSGNFIVNRQEGTVHLVDWEMPRWGDPSQDLSHFCSPLTTLWKTSYRMTGRDKQRFLREYKTRLTDNHLRDTLEDRIQLRDPFVYLRGISWSAMGWVAYQTAFNGIKNPHTWKTLQQYMDLSFIKSLFDPFLYRRG